MIESVTDSRRSSGGSPAPAATLNVALALGLYGDFTEPLKPGVDLSPWDFVALVTDRLWCRNQPRPG